MRRAFGFRILRDQSGLSLPEVMTTIVVGGVATLAVAHLWRVQFQQKRMSEVLFAMKALHRLVDEAARDPQALFKSAINGQIGTSSNFNAGNCTGGRNVALMRCIDDHVLVPAPPGWPYPPPPTCTGPSTNNDCRHDYDEGVGLTGNMGTEIDLYMRGSDIVAKTAAEIVRTRLTGTYTLDMGRQTTTGIQCSYDYATPANVNCPIRVRAYMKARCIGEPTPANCAKAQHIKIYYTIAQEVIVPHWQGRLPAIIVNDAASGAGGGGGGGGGTLGETVTMMAAEVPTRLIKPPPFMMNLCPSGQVITGINAYGDPICEQSRYRCLLDNLVEPKTNPTYVPKVCP